MYVWGRPPKLLPGETVVLRAAANRQEGRRVAAGWLFLTTKRVMFTASRLDRLFRRSDWELPREEVDGCDVAERTIAGGPFAGGLRKRLLLRTTDGSNELFVVWSPRRAQARFAQALRTIPGS